MGCDVRVGAEDARDRVSGRAARGIEIDMNAISDTVPTLAVVALFAAGPTTIRNVAHVRDKETDRIGDLVRELRRLGAEVEERPDGLTVWPTARRPAPRARIATYDDHRMAMSLALAGLRVAGVEIEDPACVGKTFPDYWKPWANWPVFRNRFHPRSEPLPASDGLSLSRRQPQPARAQQQPARATPRHALLPTLRQPGISRHLLIQSDKSAAAVLAVDSLAQADSPAPAACGRRPGSAGGSRRVVT